MATPHRGDPQKNSSEKLAKQAQQAIEEARMVLPGIQALFGFQLIAVFNTSFSRLTQGQQYLHYLAVVLIAVAIALIMTLAAYHRQAEKDPPSPFFVRLASVVIAAAMVPLMTALCIEVYLLGILILGAPLLSAAVAFALFTVFGGLWFVYPWLARTLRSSRGN
jgi:small basic protein